MRSTSFFIAVMLVGVTGLPVGPPQLLVAPAGAGPHHRIDRAYARTLPSGSSIGVMLGTPITSETAVVGDAWVGSVRSASTLGGRDVIPAGSQASGTVTSVTPARKGDRATLGLGLNLVVVGNRRYRVHGSMAPIVAGSTRGRNLGAIGAATAAGAVIGHAAAGSNKGTIVGGLVGGGAAAGAVSQTRGWQVSLKDGALLTFTTTEALAVRR